MSALRARVLGIALAALWAAACASAPPPAEAPTPPEAPPQAEGGVEVYLLPVGEFPQAVAEQMARELSTDLKLDVRASLPMGAADLQPLAPGGAYAADDLLERVRTVGARLPGRSPRSVVIALTGLDLNEPGGSLPFVFGKNDLEARTSVVSAARMGFSTPTTPVTPAVVYTRVYKMTKRAIGEQYLGLRRSSDLHDLMYAPILSLEDIDAMGSSFAARATPSARPVLPAAPEGYDWHEMPALRAAILVPDGWYVRDEQRANTQAVFVTREEIGPSGFAVGVTMNAFVGDPNGPARVKGILERAAEKNSVPLSSGSYGNFVTLSCEFQRQRKGAAQPVHLFLLGIANTHTRTSYVVIFESPQAEWESAWEVGRKILDSLALETES